MKDDIHFICLDKRTKKSNEATYVMLDNGQEILLPHTITKVPALLLLNEGHKVLFGEEIQTYFKPKNAVTQQIAQPQGEPDAFAIGGIGGGFGVASDNFSFLDQTSEELSAKGNGGMRQHHHYAGIEFSEQIDTPEDTYEPDKIGEVSMDNLQEQRNKEIGFK